MHGQKKNIKLNGYLLRVSSPLREWYLLIPSIVKHLVQLYEDSGKGQRGWRRFTGGLWLLSSGILHLAFL